MRLGRTVYVGASVFYDDVAKLAPDIAMTATGPEGEVADKMLMFVDASNAEAVGVVISKSQAEELAQLILTPRVEIARTFPGSLGGANGKPLA